VNLHPHRQKELERLVQKLGLGTEQPIQWSLLDLALTHPTASREANYEHLEFVGDAVIRLVAAKFLTETYPQMPVGELAAIRSVLVSDRTLAEIATCYSLDRYLLKSSSAERDRTGLNTRLADALEAVIGALYLSSQDLTLIRPWLDTHLQSFAQAVHEDPARHNYKAALQEWTQGELQQLPEYRVTETDPTHDAAERFTAEVWLQGECKGQGKGRSIKAAEQAAARSAFSAISSAKVRIKSGKIVKGY
jgi:ribonuclease-3